METEKSKILVHGVEQGWQIVAENLKREMFHLQFSSSISDLFSLLNKSSFDLILLLDMEHEADTINTCKQIKSDHLYNNIPVIYLSFIGDRKSVVDAYDAGADDFVGFPIDRFELIDKIDLRIFMGKRRLANSISYRENQKKIHLITNEIMNLKYEIYNQYKIHETRQRIG